MSTRITIDLLEHIRVEYHEVTERPDEILVRLKCYGLSDRTDILAWALWNTPKDRRLAQRFVKALTDGALFNRYNFEILTDTGGRTYVQPKWRPGLYPTGRNLEHVLRKAGY